MKLDNLSYSKAEGERMPKEPVIEKRPGAVGDSVVPIIEDNISNESDYSKGTPFINSTVIFIISGGSKRERDYFHPILRRGSEFKRVRIAFRSKEGQGLKPYELKQLAEEFEKTSTFVSETDDHYRIEVGDSIFLLQDVDEFGHILKQYLTDHPKSSPVKWIISNPSFEIWLFYHHFDSPAPLSHGLSLNEHDRSNWLKEHLNNIIPGGVQSTKELYQAKTAIENSKKCYSETDGFPNIFSTQMHYLAISLIDAMGSELDDILKQRAEQIERFRRGEIRYMQTADSQPAEKE